jgi:UDP-N-acetylglucosamine 3-dehydrogenase
MKIGIISFAHMHANSYAKALLDLEGVELAGIADENEERGRKAADRFQTKFYSSYMDLLIQDVDAVIIASENINHREHVIAAAKAKKHVLCEKPLSTTVKDGQDMIHACAENGVKLQVAFPVRFNTTITQMKQTVDQGEIGRIMAIKGTNRGRNPGGWFVDPLKSGGGAVMDHTVHALDIMRWLMDAEVAEVYAEVGQLFSQQPIDDAGIITFEFTNGVFATLDCSWSRNKVDPRGGDVTLELIGTKGTLSIDAFAQKIHVYSDQTGVRQRFWGDNMDTELVKDFIQNIIEDREPTVSGDDGLKTVEVVIAAYQSSEKHQSVKLR